MEWRSHPLRRRIVATGEGDDAQMLKGKVAIVVSDSGGVGGAMALCLGELGASVVVSYSSDGASANRLVFEILQCGGEAIAFDSRMFKECDYCDVVKFARAYFGHVDLFLDDTPNYSDGLEN
jgi:3-oxoacyl-[acyl-carrier protein] reductase